MSVTDATYVCERQGSTRNGLVDKGFEGVAAGACAGLALIHLLQYAVVYLT